MDSTSTSRVSFALAKCEGDNESRYRATFTCTIPSSYASDAEQTVLLTQYPILCRGSEFHLKLLAIQGTTTVSSTADVCCCRLYTEFVSPEPTVTAQAIATRLSRRIASPDPIPVTAKSMLGFGVSRN